MVTNMKASICLSTFNKARPLERTLASIFVQTPPFECEVIVCDDGSTDDTRSVCRDFPVEYHYLDRPGYCNPAAARNVAYRAARGEVIICQSDDVIHTLPDTIERLVGDLRTGRFLIATVVNVDEAGRPFSDPHGKGWGDALVRYTGPDNKRPLFFLGSLYRHDLYSIGGYDEEFIHPGYDDDWFAACLVNGRGLWAEYSADIIGHHQHHPHTEQYDEIALSRALFERKMTEGLWRASGGVWNYYEEVVPGVGVQPPGKTKEF